ncbi:uncharacterized protein LOC117892941 [Drosophila subobscura]|uniref:uncharacterized protein LOC117892941 n=1 Tax=Drosophila subobscura TaxID=7241 RepID=UPI00155A4527|nr:uncharacterized protein LOC117892941 [Drosophila subobscura]
MRIREKRRREREQRSQAQAHAQPSKRDDKKDKVIDVDAVVRPRGPIIVPRSFTPTPTLSAAEKVAFDNRIKRKNVLALNEKVAALREYDRVPVYKHVGRLFNCSPDQIKRIVQQRQEIMSAWEQRTRRTQDAGTMETKTMRVSMLGKAVYDWIRRMMYYKDFIISDGLIQKMALQFKSSMGLANFFPHQEWCDKFRSTYGIESSDTKLLKIGYTQSYSVQIKDIVKDVTSECKPNESSNQQNEGEDEQDDGNASLPSSFSSHAGEEDDEVDVDGGDISEREEEEEDVKPSLSELNLARAAHPLPQLVRLPMPLPLNTPPGTSQKVLLATPILPPGAKPPAGGAQPMTMTIIPLATLAQSITKRPSSQPQLLEKGPVVPAPMVEIKQEKDIKAEPIDPEEETETDKEVAEAMAPSKAQPDPEPEAEAAPVVRIKEEPLEEDELEDDANGGRSSVTSLAEVLAANKENEMEYIEQMRQRRQSTAAEGMPTLPPMPALTMAPAAARQGIKRRQPMDHDDNNNGGQSASGTNVISCADARKYLKLLEQFALHKGNIRLIGLITRADEVMREVDDASS